MIKIRRSNERGHIEHGWLDTFHTFSFGDYYDTDYEGFRSLRVINEDYVEAANGFGKHPHRDMEIITYVVEGELEHNDSMGNGSIIRPGDVQRMSAGRGIIHSEKNPSKEQRVHLLQIWILPEKIGIEPGYEQKHFADHEKKNRLRMVASRDGKDGSVTIHQDARLYSGILESNVELEHRLAVGRHAWIQVIKGEVLLNGNSLNSGDGAAVSEETALKLKAKSPAELLVFDLA